MPQSAIVGAPAPFVFVVPAQSASTAVQKASHGFPARAFAPIVKSVSMSAV
ncbi:MAG TPA: hypothetical protein VK841_22530 [Polyangiaceae bacterium]|nr:hypothetical protein [Polyangiaceae bacterium]